MAFTHTATHLVMGYDGDVKSRHVELSDAVTAAETLLPTVGPTYIILATVVQEVVE